MTISEFITLEVVPQVSEWMNVNMCCAVCQYPVVTLRSIVGYDETMRCIKIELNAFDWDCEVENVETGVRIMECASCKVQFSHHVDGEIVYVRPEKLVIVDHLN